MPRPTSNERISFKNYLRANKVKFTSGIQTCILGEIQDVILNISSGIDTSQVTRLIIFDDGERVGLSTVLEQQQLFYVPALPNDSIIIGVGTDGDGGSKSYAGYKLKFVGDGQGIQYGDATYGLNDVIGLGTHASLTVLGLGGGLFQPGNPPTYSVTPSSTNVFEGSTVSFTVNTTNVGAGTTLFYNIVGSASSTDFVGNSLTGSFPIEGISNNVGFATFTKTIAIDSNYNEGVEAFVVRILTGSSTNGGSVVATSSTVFIQDLGAPEYSSVTPSTTTVNEGGSVNFTINTVNVGAGTTLYFSTAGGVEAADFSDNSLTGSFNVVSTGATTGVATVTRTIAYDLNDEGDEQFTLTVRTGSTSGTGIATSPTITVRNTVPSYSVTANKTSVDEGESVTFTITTNAVPAGSTLYWTLTKISGTVAQGDLNNPTALSGGISINSSTNNVVSITKSLKRDYETETVAESVRFDLKTGSTSGPVVASSPIIYFIDTSKTPGSEADGLTFGPVQVNRDNGSAANATDWYTICDLDNVPDGSSIALFIDGSGSMTQATVQASYELLVSKLAARNITITTVTNSQEDWITPFLVDLP